MTEVYLNGGSPNYLGESVNSGNSILTKIRDKLIDVGWFLESATLSTSNNIGQNIVLKTGVNNVYFWVKFSIETNINYVDAFTLRIVASQDVNFTIASNSFDFTYIGNNSESRLWLIADSEAFCLCLRSFGGFTNGIHVGFLQRILTTDNYAFAIGWLTADQLVSKYQVAKSAHNGSNWRVIANDFSIDYSNPFNGSFCPQGTWDRHTVIIHPYGSYTNTSSYNVGKYAFNGQVNALNDKAVLGEFYYIEGFGSNTAYSSVAGMGHALYFRGPVKFAVTGMTSLLAGTQVEDGSGKRYLSVGDSPCAGFRIN